MRTNEQNAPVSGSVNDALIASARRVAGRSAVVLLVVVLATAIAVVISMWDVGARAPADLPILCVALALAACTVLAFLKIRDRAAILRRMTPDGLVGVTRLDKGNPMGNLWLHFANGDHFVLPMPPEIAPELIQALPAVPAPPTNLLRAAISWTLVLAPLGAGLILNTYPVPAKVAQIKATRGKLVLTGNLTLKEKLVVTIGKSSPLLIMTIDDGSGTHTVYVRVDAVSPEQLERARDKPGITARLIVHSERAKYDGVGMAEIETLIASSIEILEPV